MGVDFEEVVEDYEEHGEGTEEDGEGVETVVGYHGSGDIYAEEGEKRKELEKGEFFWLGLLFLLCCAVVDEEGRRFGVSWSLPPSVHLSLCLCLNGGCLYTPFCNGCAFLLKNRSCDYVCIYMQQVSLSFD